MNLENVDITDWTSETLVQFRIGIHITKDLRDWLILDFKYPGEDSGIEAWKCVDASHSKDTRYDTWDGTQVLVDSYQNCYILNNTDGETKGVSFAPKINSRRMLQDGRTLGNFTVHIMRPFNTVDMDGGDV